MEWNNEPRTSWEALVVAIDREGVERACRQGGPIAWEDVKCWAIEEWSRRAFRGERGVTSERANVNQEWGNITIGVLNFMIYR